MGIKLVECLDWTAPDRPGELLKFAEHFQKRGVNLEAFWAYHSPRGEAKMAAIGKKAEKLAAALTALGVSPRSTRCFYLAGADKAGALVAALRALAGAGINVECADALAGLGKFGAALWVPEADVERAAKLLKAR